MIKIFKVETECPQCGEKIFEVHHERGLQWRENLDGTRHERHFLPVPLKTVMSGP